MIRELNNKHKVMTEQIFDVFQNAYQVEAALIHADNFPPLNRTIEDIAHATTQFYGYFESDNLAGVIEVKVDGQRLEIDSLTVDPTYFRKGIAKKLLIWLLEHFEFSQVLVETAVENTPAIALYQKVGFVEFKRWTPAHGIPKVALSIEH